MTLQDVIYGAISGTSNFHASNKKEEEEVLRLNFASTIY
jgi:hypothetical protein